MRRFDSAQLIEMIKENLNQARHVENERITFVSFLSALIGAALAVVSEMSNFVFSALLLVVMIGAELLCITLTKRWNKVFQGHWDTAARLAWCVQECGEGELIDCAAQQSVDLKSYEHLNALFLFDNARRNPHSKHYVSTRRLFNLFNYGLLFLLLCALGYVLYGGLHV